MGDNRRFDLFAQVISKQFPPSLYKNIADIAGGQGYLQVALKEKGYQSVTSFDKRNKTVKTRRKLNYRRQLYNNKIALAHDFDLLVGMHPDEATDIIIVNAIKQNIPFVVCPCCIKPCATNLMGCKTYTNWINHLKRIAEQNRYDVLHVKLKMQGKNDVLIGRPL